MNQKLTKYSLTPLLILVAVSLLGCILCFWVCDDAFISFRYARNLANGFGLRYNLGAAPPVEGYSNLLWVLIAALVEYLRCDPTLWLPSISIVCGIFLIVRVYFFLIRQLELSPTLASVSCATMAFAPSFLVWSSSGLAPMPFALLFFLCFERLIVSENTLSAAPTFILLLLTYLVRAEAFAWLIVLLLMALVLSKNRSHIAKVAFPTLLLIITTHLAWRYSYYQEFLPNTASAKVGFSLLRLERGFNYVFVYLLTFLVPIIAATALLRIPTLLRKPNLFAALAFFFGFYAYSVLVGGDYMSMGRFLVPALAFQTIALALLLQKLPSKLGPAFAAVLILIGLLPMANVHIVPHSIRSKFHFRHNRSEFIGELEHWQFMQSNSNRWREEGILLASLTKNDESIVEGAIGNVGYFSNLTIFDRMGLVSRIPKRATPKTLRSPGHDIRVPAEYFLPLKPTYLWYKQMGPAGLRNLMNNMPNTTHPYAPVVHELNIEERNKFVVLLTRIEDEGKRKDAWNAVALLVEAQ